MKSRARWAREDNPRPVEDLSNNLSKAAKQLTIAQLADAIGLSTKTIQDSLTRDKITDPGSPRGAIDRPDFMVGGDPLWSHEQLDEYLRRRAAADEAAANKPELPTISSADANEQGLISTNELAELLQKHDQTIRRWEANFRDTYPPAIARRSRDGRPGVPEHVRDLSKILTWIEEHGIQIEPNSVVLARMRVGKKAAAK